MESNNKPVLEEQIQVKNSFADIIYISKKIKDIIELAKKIAETEATTILLLGESGTGKDVFARAIHNSSSRSNQPFVTINCSTLPETLLESEFFGHEKGAFTDAQTQKKGLFEIAENGTIFLDEIGEINPTTQIKLLWVLETRTIRRLGSTQDIKINVRIIAATNKNLVNAIKENAFRGDLYYRLKVFQITLPPLRERKEDIPLLVEHFIKLFNVQFEKQVTKVEPQARKLLLQYNWPGNIRELRNVIERVVILETDNTIREKALPLELRNIDTETASSEQIFNFELPEKGFSLPEFEKQVVKQALYKASNNQTRAAKLLGISRDTLRYKIKKFQL